MASLGERLEAVNTNIDAGKEAIVSALNAIGFATNLISDTYDSTLTSTQGWRNASSVTIDYIDGYSCMKVSTLDGIRTDGYIFEEGQYDIVIDIYPTTTGVLWFRMSNSSNQYSGDFTVTSDMLNRWQTITITCDTTGLGGTNLSLMGGTSVPVYMKNVYLYDSNEDRPNTSMTFAELSEYIKQSKVNLIVPSSLRLMKGVK